MKRLIHPGGAAPFIAFALATVALAAPLVLTPTSADAQLVLQGAGGDFLPVVAAEPVVRRC